MIYSMRLGFIITAASSARAMKPRSARFSPRRRMANMSADEAIESAYAKLQGATARAAAKQEKINIALKKMEEEIPHDQDVAARYAKAEEMRTAYAELEEKIIGAHAKMHEKDQYGVPEYVRDTALEILNGEQSFTKFEEWVVTIGKKFDKTEASVMFSLQEAAKSKSLADTISGLRQIMLTPDEYIRSARKYETKEDLKSEEYFRSIALWHFRCEKKRSLLSFGRV